MRIVESWMTDRYHDAASPRSGRATSPDAARAGPDLLTALNYSQVVNYNQQEIDAFDLTAKSRCAAATGTPGATPRCSPGTQPAGSLASGKLRRNAGLAGFSFRPSREALREPGQRRRFERPHLFPDQPELQRRDALCSRPVPVLVGPQGRGFCDPVRKRRGLRRLQAQFLRRRYPAVAGTPRAVRAGPGSEAQGLGAEGEDLAEGPGKGEG